MTRPDLSSPAPLPPVGSHVLLHFGIDGEWEVLSHQAPPGHPALGHRIDVRARGSEGRGVGIPASYVREVLIAPGQRKPFPRPQTQVLP